MWAAAHAAYYDRRGNRCGQSAGKARDRKNRTDRKNQQQFLLPSVDLPSPAGSSDPVAGFDLATNLAAGKISLLAGFLDALPDALPIFWQRKRPRLPRFAEMRPFGALTRLTIAMRAECPFSATETAPPSRFAKRGPFAVHRAASMSSSFCARALCPSRSRRRMSVEETSSPCSYTGGTMTAAKSMVALISPMRRASPCP